MKAKEVKIVYDSKDLKTDIFINDVKMLNKNPLIKKVNGKRLIEWKDIFPKEIAASINRKSFTLKFEGTAKDRTVLQDAIESYNNKQSKYKILFNVPIVMLSYNPYSVKTKIIIDDAEIAEGVLVDKTNYKRLQDWIDNILKDIFEKVDNISIVLLFKGTALDGEDVENAVQIFNRENCNQSIELKLDVIKEKSEHKKTQLQKLFNKAEKESPFDEFRNDTLKKEFENALSPELEVNVIATMSSGKSTLINAMLGKELMPARNEACTATIAKITDRDNLDNFKARRTYADKNEIEDFQKADLNLISKWNDDKETSIIEIEGNIPAIKEREDMRLVLVDTPGPNNSRNQSHREATVKAIMGTQLSMVLYVLNATQLSTEDDQILLNMIRDTIEEGGREAQDRFIFIANKIDYLDPEDNNESIESALENVRNYLKDNGIKNPLVIPVSSELAKLLRIEQLDGDNALTIKQNNKLLKLKDLFTEEDEMNMLKHVQKYINRQSFEKMNNKLSKGSQNEQVEIKSGIPVIEELLDNYISKYAVPMQISDAVSSFSTVIARAKAIEKMNNVLKQNQDELKDIKIKIENFNNDKSRIVKAHEFREKVKNEKYKISKEASCEQDKIEIKVGELLDKEQKNFKEKCSPQEAEKIFKKTEMECDFLFTEIKEILVRSLDNEFYSNMNLLKQDYQTYIIHILNENFPNDYIIKELQFSTMELPDAKSLIKKNTSEEEKSVCIGTTRYGFLWLKKRNIYRTTYEDLVDMSKVFEDLSTKIKERKIKQLKDFEKSAKENIESAKQILLNEMDKIDGRMEENLKKLSLASQNETEKKEIIEKNMYALEWFDNFMQDLKENIISI